MTLLADRALLARASGKTVFETGTILLPFIFPSLKHRSNARSLSSYLVIMKQQSRGWKPTLGKVELRDGKSKGPWWHHWTTTLMWGLG